MNAKIIAALAVLSLTGCASFSQGLAAVGAGMRQAGSEVRDSANQRYARDSSIATPMPTPKAPVNTTCSVNGNWVNCTSY